MLAMITMIIMVIILMKILIYTLDLARLLSQTKQQLEPPVMDIIERKLQIGYQEKFYESTYSNDDVCALYFYWNPTQGPFCIIPSLQLDEKYSSYKLTSNSAGKT